MKRWRLGAGEEVQMDDVDAFIDDVISVCRKHGMSISHEDQHGAFVIEKFSEICASWFRNASIGWGFSDVDKKDNLSVKSWVDGKVETLQQGGE